MWPSANNRSRGQARFIVIGNPDSRRTALFQAALVDLGLQARLVPYRDLLAERVRLTDVVRPGSVVRIESPDKDGAVEREMIALGAGIEDDERFPRIARESALRLPYEKGAILYPRQWYRGFCQALGIIRQQLSHCPAHTLMNDPADIEMMFDKVRCHQMLTRSKVPVPPALGEVRSFDELIERMRRLGCYRVFVKTAHGSSASGVVAYQTDGRRHQATTTVEMVRRCGELRLYNSRRIQIYRDPQQIHELLDALCRHGVHVEAWVPKAGLDGRTFDLRVVVIAGRTRHVVLRSSRSPMTNLHLLNARGNVDGLRCRMGPEKWQQAMSTCELAMENFPRSLYAGLDLLIRPCFEKHAVLEINAFGDLLPGITWQGRDTYTTEVLAVQASGAGNRTAAMSLSR